MKIFFSLPSNASSSKPNPIKPSTSLDDDQFNSDAVASIEYNHQFTAVAIDVDPTVPRVIPHIPNEWQPDSGKKKIIVESEEAVLKEEFKRLLKHIGVKEFENYLVEGFWEALLAGRNEESARMLRRMSVLSSSRPMSAEKDTWEDKSLIFFFGEKS